MCTDSLNCSLPYFVETQTLTRPRSMRLTEPGLHGALSKNQKEAHFASKLPRPQQRRPAGRKEPEGTGSGWNAARMLSPDAGTHPFPWASHHYSCIPTEEWATLFYLAQSLHKNERSQVVGAQEALWAPRAFSFLWHLGVDRSQCDLVPPLYRSVTTLLLFHSVLQLEPRASHFSCTRQELHP